MDGLSSSPSTNTHSPVEGESMTPASLSSSSTSPLSTENEGNSPPHTLAEAKREYDNGNFQEVLRISDRLIALFPEDTAALLFAGAAAFQLKRFEDCLQYNCRAISIDPTLAECYGNAGNALKEMGKVHEALRLYHKAMKLKPRFPDVYNNTAAAYVLLGDLQKARDYFAMAVHLNPDFADAWANLGSVNRSLGMLAEARSCYNQAVRIQPKFTQAWIILGMLAKEAGQMPLAAECYGRAADLVPHCEEVLLAHGTLLRENGKTAAAKEIFQRLVSLRPEIALYHANLATTLYDLGDMTGSIAAYRCALELDPRNADCLNNIGNAFREIGHINESIVCYKAALRINDRHPHAWNNWGNSLKDQGFFREATACYLTACWLQPNFAAGHSNLASVLKEQGLADQAVREYAEALRIDPGFADAWSNLGNAMKDCGRFDDATRCYATAIHLKPLFSDAYCNLASAQKDMGRVEESIACYQRALELKPDSPDALSNFVHATVLVCDWRQRRANFAKLAASLLRQLDAAVAQAPMSSGVVNKGAAAPTVQPFHSLVYPMSLRHMHMLAGAYAMRAAKVAEGFGLPPFTHVLRQYAGERIRLGYVSSDFGNHPLSHLMQSVFGMHDRTKFEVFCYALSPHDASTWRAKIAAEVEHFVDVSKLPASGIAQRINQDRIHVLVNLNGYTKGAKNEVFALRPCPIQIAYMGFCGTMGASYIDYIIADHTVIPDSATEHYSEKVVYMPHSYFVNDHRQSAQFVLDKSSLPSRAQFGIPTNKFVFANFNQIYKLDPETFRTWCNILHRVPNSVLWLLRFPAAGERNIRLAARAFGITDDRIIFTDVSMKDEHLKRGPLCDLFLDTLVCNAHTTGCDILWGGVPMLTVPGAKMASRVAASLLVAAGLQECICSSLEEYEETAVQLATHPAELAALRHRMETARMSCPLFDTLRWVRNLEGGVSMVMDRAETGLPPDHVDVDDVGGCPSKPCTTEYLLEPCMLSDTRPTDAAGSEEAILAYSKLTPYDEPRLHLPGPLTVPPTFGLEAAATSQVYAAFPVPSLGEAPPAPFAPVPVWAKPVHPSYCAPQCHLSIPFTGASGAYSAPHMVCPPMHLPRARPPITLVPGAHHYPPRDFRPLAIPLTPHTWSARSSPFPVPVTPCWPTPTPQPPGRAPLGIASVIKHKNEAPALRKYAAQRLAAMGR